MALPHERLRRYWNDDATPVHSVGADERALAQLERRYGIELPKDFRAYLLHAAPADDQVDSNSTEWWSLNRIGSITDICEHELTSSEIASNADASLLFADYAIWCMAWAICCRPGDNYGRVVLISGNNDRFVADSFATFVEQYVADHRALL